nr:START domain, START-like domain protein [Tanacetum cinerariifolium]
MYRVESFSEIFEVLRFSEILSRQKGGIVVVVEMLVFVSCVLIAFCIGIIIGWVWKPRWASFGNCTFDGLEVKNQTIGSNPRQKSVQVETNLGFASISVDSNKMVENLVESTSMDNPSCSSSVVKKNEDNLLKDEDLKHLWQLVEKRDAGPPWKHMMDESTPQMTFQAWQRDQESGPPQYRSITVYEDATPELLRDFFWDDKVRPKWDDMLLYSKTLDEFPAVGASVVHWIRKFPFFCDNREYTIGRRIWESERSFYCVTKGVSCPSIQRKQKPRRVDIYYSSWFIRSVRSIKGNNQPACEVIFFHHEDMGIPWGLAKIGVRQGMWGTAKKIEQGLRWYKKERACSNKISHHVALAQMSTKIDQNYLTCLESEENEDDSHLVPHRLESDENEDDSHTETLIPLEKQGGLSINMPKFLVIGGAVILACSLNRGLVTKGVVFEVAKRFGNIGRRALP